jgi:DMSO/TMAO reductase YedYZ molybdopterin-dependent catalytic subunit
MVLTSVALATGGLAFVVGGRGARLVTFLHAASGLGLVVVSGRKTAIARRSLGRRRSTSPSVVGSLVLGALVVACLGAGVAHSAGAGALAGLTMMQLHVGTALAVVPLLVVHARLRPSPGEGPTRRDVLRLGAVVARGALAAVVVEATVGATRRPTGSIEASGALPVTQWLLDPVPDVEVASWRLSVDQSSLDHGQLLALPRTEVRAVLDCTGGWWAERRWAGVRLRDLVGDVEDRSEGRSVVVRSITGYQRRLPLSELDNAILATHLDGEPLSAGHGSPARLVVPGRRGYWWVKWVDGVAVEDVPWWWQPPLPLQ